MDHRKEKHSNSIAPCRNYEVGRCPYSDKMCWWKHGILNEAVNQEIINCYFCDENFITMDSVMKHRKTKHPTTIKECNKLSNEGCRFTSDSCWFHHSSKQREEEHKEKEHEEGAGDKTRNKRETEEQSGFRQAFQRRRSL